MLLGLDAAATVAAVLLSFTRVESRISNWRAEFVKCSYHNYELNASRAIQLCGQRPNYFCCRFESSSVAEKCCTLGEFLHELRLLFYVCKMLSIFAFLLLLVIVLFSAYILIKSKKLLRHIYRGEETKTTKKCK